MTSEPASSIEWRLPRAISGAILLAWWLLFGLYYYREPLYAPIWNLLPHMLPNPFEMRPAVLWSDLKAAAGLIWLLFLGWGIGRAILRRARLDANNFIGNFFMSLGLGWGVMALAMLTAGLLHLWDLRLVMTCVAAATAALLADLRRRRPLEDRAIGAKPVAGVRPDIFASPWTWVWAGIFGLFAVFNLFAAFMPEISYDALVYHLALPELYWLHGRILATPENIYSGLPMLIQMLYALALPLGGDALAHLVHWSLGVGTALTVYALCRDISDETTALEAALFFYTVPLVGVLSWKAGVDLGWAFFQILSIYALARRLDRAPEGEARRWTVLAGVFAGLAMGTKYQAWPMLGLAACAFFLLLPAGLAVKDRLKESCLFSSAALAALLPWLIKDLVLYGNPLYPFFHEYLGRGPLPPWRGLLSDGGRKDLPALLTTWPGVKSLLLLPWSVTFQNNDLNSLGPIFLFGVPIFFLGRFRSPRARLSAYVFLGLASAWALSSSLSRFLLPSLPLACVLFALALRELPDGLKSVARFGLVFFFAVNFFWLASWPYTYEAGPVLLGDRSKAEYLAVPHPGYARPAYEAVQYVNGHLPRDARVLFIGEGRSFYCERDRIAMTRLDPEPLLGWIRASKDARALADRLRREGIGAVVLNVNELLLWQQGPNRYLPLDDREEFVFSDFRNRFLRPVAEFKGDPKADFSWPWVTVNEITDGL
jgi:hypothetical protein